MKQDISNAEGDKNDMLTSSIGTFRRFPSNKGSLISSNRHFRYRDDRSIASFSISSF
jgi:hypothetical protein